jgi:transcriptional regulator with XRE-family HTH domain
MEFSPASSLLNSHATFGDLLKYLRRRAHLTQLELSIAVGYSEAQISRLEKNQRLPDLTAVQALFIPALHLEDEPQLSTRLLELARSARLEDAPTPGIAPYMGLLFFDESNSELFFGREALTSQIARHVISLAMEPSTRLLTVVGASGSGKSSLVRAGLAVALKQAGWEVRLFTPTADPLRILEANLNWRITSDPERVLILVDQFEELFTLCQDELERITFIERLLSTAQDKSKTVTVVIVLRADFYSHCAQYPLLRQMVATEQEYMGQMSFEELRRAIEEPARHGGWEFEPGLVEVLLNDIGTYRSKEPEPGALPLLSHALLATWERRRGRTFTIEGYRASGGVRGAIAETAESVFADQLNRIQQELARNIFLRLTKLGEGTEDTSRRATLNELARQPEEAAQLRVVLNILADARLITLNEDSAEVAHEALIREWARLHEWLNQDREGLRLRQHLTESAREWEARERDSAELYRGTRLIQAKEWVSSNESLLNTSERAFIDLSIEQEQRDAVEHERQRQLELETAQKLAKAEQRRAEEQTRFANQMRQRARYLTVVFVIALIMACTALSFSNQSNLNALAASNARATAAANNDTAAKLFNAVIGTELLPPSGSTEPESISTYSPNGKMKAIEEGKVIIVRDTDTSNRLFTLTGHTDLISSIAFSPDGSQLASSSFDDTAILWDLTNGKAIFTLKGHASPVESVAFSPDGKQVVTASDDMTAIIWDVTTGKQLITLTGDAGMRGAIYNPDGTHIATANINGTANIWDALSGRELLTLRGHSGAVISIAFSPDGKWLATVSIDGTAKIWDASTGDILYQFSR